MMKAHEDETRQGEQVRKTAGLKQFLVVLTQPQITTITYNETVKGNTNK